MKFLVWLLRAAIFFLLFAFSLNNQHDIVVHWFFGAQWRGPLVLAVLVAFGLGLLIGLGSWLPARRRVQPPQPVPASTTAHRATERAARSAPTPPDADAAAATAAARPTPPPPEHV